MEHAKRVLLVGVDIHTADHFADAMVKRQISAITFEKKFIFIDKASYKIKI